MTPKPRRGLIALAVVVVLVIGAVLLGQLGIGTTPPTTGTNTNTTTTTEAPADGVIAPQAGATRLVSGVPVGYPQTKNGALAAATNYLTTIYGDVALIGPKGPAMVAAVAVPGQDAALYAELRPGIDGARAAFGTDDQGNIPKGMPVLFHMLPMRYTITSYDQQNAVIEIWWMGVQGVAAEDTAFPVMDKFATTTVTLAWAGGDWKLASTAEKTGPAPMAGTDPSNADEVARTLPMTAYGYGA